MLKRLLAITLCSAFTTTWAQTSDKPAIDPKADEALRKMTTTLADAKALSVDVHSMTDQMLSPDGPSLQHARNQKILIRRPDRAMAIVTGDHESFRFSYDGRRAVLFNPDTSAYAAIDTPSTLDQTLDVLAREYGMALPLADLFFADPYKVLTEQVTAGQYVGTGFVFDAKCHHLAFTQHALDWQIWIDAGDKPLPRKVTITYKRLAGQPRFTAFLSNWNLAADAPDSAFAFNAPAGANQVPWLAPSTQPAATSDATTRQPAK